MIYIDLPITKWWFVQSFVGENGIICVGHVVRVKLLQHLSWWQQPDDPSEDWLISLSWVPESFLLIALISFHIMEWCQLSSMFLVPLVTKNSTSGIIWVTSIAWDNSAAVASTFKMTSWHRSCGRACYKVPQWWLIKPICFFKISIPLPTIES